MTGDPASSGTETTGTMNDHYDRLVFERDGRTCLACGGEGIFALEGDTNLVVLKRDPGWRHVPANLATFCDLHAALLGGPEAFASGWSHRVRTGDPVDRVPFLTHAGYRFLNHRGELLMRRPAK